MGFVCATQQGSACSKQTANSRRQFKRKTLCAIGDRTVFQSELFALKKAALWMLRNKQLIANDEMHIYCDSQSALKALRAHFVKSKLLLETIKLLNNAVVFTNVQWIMLHWIQGHAGHHGNERADREANLSTEL